MHRLIINERINMYIYIYALYNNNIYLGIVDSADCRTVTAAASVLGGYMFDGIPTIILAAVLFYRSSYIII